MSPNGIGGREMRLFRRAFIAIGLSLLWATAVPTAVEAADKEAATQVAAADAKAEYAANGEQTCLKCHDKAPATNILHTKHAVKGDARTPFANHQCESCHGASPQHTRKGAEGEKRAPPTVTFGPKASTPVEEQNKVCEGCHENSARISWKGSQHQFAGVACVSCHDLHTPRDPVLSKTSQPEVCFNCHKQQRAELHKPSHHPVIEGKVGCAECHNPHGSPTDKLLSGITVNDTCYQCHAEKRGPFLWEHGPVREDCTICHTPHGSVQPALLKNRAPFLCQQCHQIGHHPFGARGDTDLAGFQPQLVGKACLNCHQQVHGSNHPSGVRNMR